jgi:hypothetical protein
MRTGPGAGGTLRATAVALALLVAGCSHMPWHRNPPVPPAAVHELQVEGGAATSYPQYWKRNTLLVDLTAASGTGSIVLKPATAAGWPVRLAFRVTPGAVGVLDVRAAARVNLPINASGAHPVELELPPGIYSPTSPQMTVAWAPAATP